jgi:hypothetical protein
MEERAKRIRNQPRARTAPRQCAAIQQTRDPYHALIGRPGVFASAVKVSHGQGWKQGAIVVQPLERIWYPPGALAQLPQSADRLCTAVPTGRRRMWFSSWKARRAAGRPGGDGHRARIFWGYLKTMS